MGRRCCSIPMASLAMAPNRWVDTTPRLNDVHQRTPESECTSTSALDRRALLSWAHLRSPTIPRLEAGMTKPVAGGVTLRTEDSA